MGDRFLSSTSAGKNCAPSRRVPNPSPVILHPWVLENYENRGFSSLSFLSLLFWKVARKTTEKTRIFYPCRTPKIPGKKAKNSKKTRKSSQGEKQGIPKKTRKGRTGIYFSYFFVFWFRERIRGVFWGSEGFCIPYGPQEIAMLQYRTGVWKCPRSLPPDPSPSTG